MTLTNAFFFAVAILIMYLAAKYLDYVLIVVGILTAIWLVYLAWLIVTGNA